MIANHYPATHASRTKSPTNDPNYLTGGYINEGATAISRLNHRIELELLCTRCGNDFRTDDASRYFQCVLPYV